MNLQIFNNPDPSGRMSKESFLFKNYKEEYDYIIEYCTKNEIFDITFKEKVYLTINKLNSVPLCKNPNCRKRVNFKNSTIGYLEYCSIKCISSDPSIKKIKEEKSLKKFGTKSPAQSKEVKDKANKTNQERYGHNSAMCLIETQEKSKQTLLKNWGVDNPNKSLELSNRRIESFKLSNYKETYEETSLKRYGVKHPWMDNNIHKKTIKSSIILKNINTKNAILKMIDIKKYKLIEIKYEIGNNLVKLECPKNHIFETTREFIYNRFRIKSEICCICNPISQLRSGSEISLSNFIKEKYKDDIVENDRNILKKFEIDIFLPKKNIGIEYNGLWYHSSEYRDNNYHFFKQKTAQQCNINLITVWEDDWIYKNDIIKSVLLNRLNLIETRIYARKCNISILNNEETDIFLRENHLQGSCKSSIRIGLRMNDDIVCVATFNKNNTEYILNRFCSKINISVIGGFSKILKYFINLKLTKQIITYSDNMIFDGNIYQHNGFILVNDSYPTYTLLVNRKRTHRLSIKSNINDYPKIYNSGLKKWILKLI